MRRFTFQVQDNGGTANGGVNLDQSPNTMTINVTPVAEAPIVTVPGPITLGEGGTAALYITVAQADPDDTLGNVTITGLPTGASITDALDHNVFNGGVSITLTAAQVASGPLSPPARRPPGR